jgi:ATP-binding cassette subfamily B protein/subfamily B ATP-binding cassette protein MsbA
LQGHLTLGSLLVFISYLGSLQIQLKAFSGIYTAMQGFGAKIDRVCEIMEVDPEIHDRPGAAPIAMPVAGHVVIENVTFGYNPDRPVLRNLSLEAKAGETIALVGPTGAGKSTLVGLIPRFFDPWEGRVLLDGRDLRDVQIKTLRQQVSLVLQEPFLFPFSVAENIAYGSPDATRDQIIAAAKAANAHEFIERIPDGYDALLGERGSTLSGGERQRLSIARAILKDSPILILDEPTSALDANTEHLILQALERLMEGRTTFIIAHRVSTVRNADKIAVIQDGRIRELGHHLELVENGELYARLHAIQTGQLDDDLEAMAFAKAAELKLGVPS